MWPLPPAAHSATSGNWVLSPVPVGVWVAPPLLPADFTKVPAKRRASLQPARLSLQCPRGAPEMSPSIPEASQTLKLPPPVPILGWAPGEPCSLLPLLLVPLGASEPRGAYLGHGGGGGGR